MADDAVDRYAGLLARLVRLAPDWDSVISAPEPTEPAGASTVPSAV